MLSHDRPSSSQSVIVPIAIFIYARLTIIPVVVLGFIITIILPTRVYIIMIRVYALGFLWLYDPNTL